MAQKIADMLKEGQFWWVKLPDEKQTCLVKILGVNRAIVTFGTLQPDGGTFYETYAVDDVTWVQER